MNKFHNSQKNNKSIEDETKYGRRLFLQQAMVGGVILASTSTVFAEETYKTADVCANASFIDALLFQLSQISQLQSDILTCLVKTYQIELGKCRRDFTDLSKLIEALEKEICNSQKGRQTTSAAEIVELGRTNVKLIQTSISEQAFKPYVAAIDLINQQMLSKAQECLPDGDINLTPEAIRLLKKIINFIKDPAQRISKEIQDLENAHSDKSGNVDKVFRQVRLHIEKASTELVIGETPTDKEKIATEALKTAFKEIGNAIQQLKEVLNLDLPLNCKVLSKFPTLESFESLPNNLMKITEKDVSSVFLIKSLDTPISDEEALSNADKIESFDFIVFSLEGIRRGIIKEYNIQPSSITKKNGSQNNYKFASFEPEYKSSKLAYPDLETIGRFLIRHALGDTPSRRLDVDRRIKDIKGYTAFDTLLLNVVDSIIGLPPSVRKTLIRRSLDGFEILPKLPRLPSNYDPSLDKLAIALANSIT